MAAVPPPRPGSSDGPDAVLTISQIAADDRLIEGVRLGTIGPDHADPLAGMLAGWRRSVMLQPA